MLQTRQEVCSKVQTKQEAASRQIKTTYGSELICVGTLNLRDSWSRVRDRRKKRKLVCRIIQMASSQADPDTEVKRLVKVTVFLKKKPGITDEEFHRYWSEKHGPLLSSFPIFREKILKYTQYHNDMALTSKAASLMGSVPTLEFDGAAEFWVTDLDSLFSVWFDQEFLKVVQPDEQNFVSHENLKIMIGYEDVMMDRT